MVGRPSAARRPSLPSSPGGGGAPPRVTLPNLVKDPVWSLRPWPLVVYLGGEEYEVPALPAADWLAYLMREEPDFDGMILDFFPESEDKLMDGTLDVDDLYETCFDVLETVGGRMWWVTLRLVNLARESWHILGPQMLEAIDFEHVSIAAWLDVLLVKIVHSMDPKDTAMFAARLEAPPPEFAPEDPIEEMTMDRSAFLSMQ